MQLSTKQSNGQEISNCHTVIGFNSIAQFKDSETKVNINNSDNAHQNMMNNNEKSATKNTKTVTQNSNNKVVIEHQNKANNH